MLVDDVATTAQRHLVAALVVIVRIEAGHLAQGSVALNLHEVLERAHDAVYIGAHGSRVASHGLRVDLKHGFVGVFQAPHQHMANHHRVALLVVDLDGLGVDVARAKGEALCVDEWVHPIEAHALERALVLAEEHHDTCLVGLLLHKTFGAKQKADEEEGTDDAGHGILGNDAQDEPSAYGQNQGENDEER